jgi:hypothetical protein
MLRWLSRLRHGRRLPGSAMVQASQCPGEVRLPRPRSPGVPPGEADGDVSLAVFGVLWSEPVEVPALPALVQVVRLARSTVVRRGHGP